MTNKTVQRPSDSRAECSLFVPLKTEYYEAFRDGSKTVEYRKYGPGWNERTCRVGRLVVLSKGYGKAHRMNGVITGFSKRRMSSRAWLDCYGTPGTAACIHIKVLYGRLEAWGL